MKNRLKQKRAGPGRRRVDEMTCQDYLEGLHVRLHGDRPFPPPQAKLLPAFPEVSEVPKQRVMSDGNQLCDSCEGGVGVINQSGPIIPRLESDATCVVDAVTV